MVSIQLLLEREGEITLTRLVQWVLTNDGDVSCAQSDTVTVTNWEEGRLYWIDWDYGGRKMGTMLLIINPILLLVLMAFVDKDNVVIILGGRDIFVYAD